MNIADAVRSCLVEHAAVSSVGPIMTDALEAAGLPADIIPIHPKMAGLVKASAELSAATLAKKRRPRS